MYFRFFPQRELNFSEIVTSCISKKEEKIYIFKIILQRRDNKNLEKLKQKNYKSPISLKFKWLLVQLWLISSKQFF